MIQAKIRFEGEEGEGQVIQYDPQSFRLEGEGLGKYRNKRVTITFTGGERNGTVVYLGGCYRLE